MSTTRNTDIEFELVRRKNMSNIRLAVLPPDGRVRVSAPYGIPNAVIDDFIASRTDWINSQQAKIAARPRRWPEKFETGQQCSIWGQAVTLQIEEGAHVEAKLCGSLLTLQVPTANKSAQAQIAYETFLRTQLTSKLEQLVPIYEERTGLKCNDWQVRKMSSRWGSCTLATGKIRFALSLAQYPQECTEQVVVHELGHLLYPNHGREFQAFMDTYYPNWRQIRKLLK